jgi:hypothetical protein
MPSPVGYSLDLNTYNEENQSQPLLLTNKGKWQAEDGKIYNGGGEITLKIALNRLPYFTKL